MSDEPAFRLYFDFTDPLSRVLEHAVAQIEPGLAGTIERVGIEAYPFPTPPPAPTSRDWAGRYADAERGEDSVDLRWSRPRLIPWSRKAHELCRVAGDDETRAEMRFAIFEAFFRDGLDIGRIDVLVALAVELGMPAMETKAALDVDREEEAVLRARARAEEDGVVRTPTLIAPWGRLEGFHNRSALRTFLRLP